MNIFSISSTQGAASVGGVKGVESTAATSRTAAEGLSSVNDGVSLSVDAVQAASSASDIRFDRVNAIKAAIAEPKISLADEEPEEELTEEKDITAAAAVMQIIEDRDNELTAIYGMMDDYDKRLEALEGKLADQAGGEDSTDEADSPSRAILDRVRSIVGKPDQDDAGTILQKMKDASDVMRGRK